MSSRSNQHPQGTLQRCLLLGLILIAAFVLPRIASAQAPGTSETELLFWKSAIENENPAAYHAYLQVFPSGQFTELAKARGGDSAVPPASSTLALAVTRHRLSALRAPVEVRDEATADTCGLTAGDIVALKQVPAETDTTIRLEVVTSKRGDCRAAATVEAERADMTELLDQLARLEPSAKPRVEATAAERLFWQSIAGSRRPSDYQAYLKTYPDGPFAGLAGVRLNEIAPPPEAPPAAPANPAESPPATEDIARNAESALALPRSQWVLIQRGLTVLGYNAGTPDGMPGDRTRQAIQQFQRKQQAPQTGFLTQPQLTALLDQTREPLAREDRERAAATAATAAAEQARQEAERPRNRWAAVEHDDKDKFYADYNADTEEQAKTKVHRACMADPNSTRCTFDRTLVNQCFALARDGSFWNWSVRATVAEARAAALTACSAAHSACTSTWHWCSNGTQRLN